MTQTSNGHGAGAVARRCVAAVIGAEAIVVGGYGFVLALLTLVAEKPVSRTAAAFLALTAVLLGVGITTVAVSLWRGYRAARAPALVWQVLQAALAVPALSTSPGLGVALLVPAVVAGAGLFVPGVVDERSPGSASGR